MKAVEKAHERTGGREKGGYRFLTAKREKTGKLTTAEEQQLLEVEQALGQKLAFDMEGVKGEATVNDSLTVQPTPQIPPPAPLFSIGKPSEVFNDSLNDSPNFHKYIDEPASNPRIQEALNSTARKLFGGIEPVTNRSETWSDVVRDFEKNTGLAVQTFRIPGGNNYRRHSAFVHPDTPKVIFVNSASNVPAKSLLPHEWLHNASHDSQVATLADEFMALLVARNLLLG